LEAISSSGVADPLTFGGRCPAAREAELLVQNVHAFLAEYGVKRPTDPPHEHAIVFNEAQRTWHAEKLRKRRASLSVSEAGLVLDVMSRGEGRATVAIRIPARSSGSQALDVHPRPERSRASVKDSVIEPLK
jgi:hypothetical protein